ncbi:ribokinase [Microbacterium sp. 179-I 3D3 NHS]|uniref:ribokinase n=1 Tax=Microbacterium sp. 179-I 3D3 NHS TaxID=3142382 RepID=UPI0039A190E5
MTQITVVGSINVDLTSRSARLPSPGETVGAGSFTRQAGGKGANQAVALSRLGATSHMVGSVGRDEPGSFALDNLRNAGVLVDHVAVRDAQTGVALVMVDGDGENQIVICPGANDEVGAEVFDFIDGAVLTQLEIPMKSVENLAQTTTGFLAVNSAPATPLSDGIVARGDLFIANETEFALTPKLRDARLLVVTHGGAGAVMYEYGKEVARATAPRVDVVSTVGAGDAFCAALTFAIVSGLSSEVALQAACAVGSHAVEHEAAQPPLRPLAEYL